MTLSAAEAQLAGARVMLAAVVGNDRLPRLAVPATVASKRSDRAADPPAGHPRIVAAERAVAAAQANARLVAIADREDPEIGLQGINEKQPGSRWDTRFGVVIRFPFATEARNAPLRAAAEQGITQAQVQLALARREVLSELRQSEAMLVGAEHGSIAANRAAEELERRRSQIERAWRLGEMPLIEMVRANALAFDAAYAAGKVRIDLDTARLRQLLAQGVLP